MEHRFGQSHPLSLGVEEEIMILDGETLMPAPQVATLVEGTAEAALPGLLKTELHASVVELNTAVASNGLEVLASVQALRAAAEEVARENGLRIAAAGSHPLAHAEDLVIVQEQRYLDFVEYAGVSAIRPWVMVLIHIPQSPIKRLCGRRCR